MLHSIHHVNFLVRNLDTAVARWRKILDLDCEIRESLPGRGVDTARFRVGVTWLVLVQPTNPDSVPGRHLEEHGEGVFLLSFGVDDLDAAAAAIDARGATCGAERSGLDSWRVVDVGAAIGGSTAIQLTRVKH
jgi:methylmalonyl-CoA/ethylmalonyl-CoA epimerase